MKIIKNMSRIDRSVRFSMGLILFILSLTDVITSNIVLAFSVLIMASSSIGSCPVYLPLNFSTKPSEEAD